MNKTIDMEIIDTNGEWDEPALAIARQTFYADADVFMICVSESDAASYEQIEEWKRQIQTVEKASDKPILLVLTKYDDPTKTELSNGHTIADMEQKKRENHFQYFSKTSSQNNENDNVQKLFTMAITAAKWHRDD